MPSATLPGAVTGREERSGAYGTVYLTRVYEDGRAPRPAIIHAPEPCGVLKAAFSRPPIAILSGSSSGPLRREPTVPMLGAFLLCLLMSSNWLIYLIHAPGVCSGAQYPTDKRRLLSARFRRLRGAEL
jgi:hypothetical protein